MPDRYSPLVWQRYRMLSMVKDNLLTLKEASKNLHLSYRHTRRVFHHLLQAKMNPDVLLYKRSHPAWNRLPCEEKEKVIKVFDLYPEINSCHLSDILKEELGKCISPSTVRSILIESGRYNLRRKRRRPRKRFERKSFGELVQMDTSEHMWVPALGKRTYLVALMDDYSRELLAARIFSSDTSWNSLYMIRKVVEEYGIFSSLYTDNDSMFKFIRKGFSMHFEYRSDLEKIQTQIHRALLELGTVLIHHEPFQPACKGKIERIFGFMQQRLHYPLRDVKDLFEANTVLDNWRFWYNTEHINSSTGLRACDRHQPSCFKPLPKGVNLDDIFCFKDVRAIKKDNTFSYQSKVYQITNCIHRLSWNKAKVTLHIIPEQCIRVFYQGKFIQEFPYQK
ncbi:transposase [Candidatus Aerophobetes bacterium]|nr:transposase [Candidatus Aerophobetes bacterium]